MAWVYLDDQFFDHPKVVLAGGDAAWLFVCGLGYCRRYATEGAIPVNQVSKLSDRRSPAKLAKRLVEVGLWEADGEHYRVHDYADWNKPQESRTASARKAATARWAAERKQKNRDASGNAPRIADASEPQSEPDAESSAEPDASGCPPPHTPDPSNQVSSPSGGDAAHSPVDDDDERIDQLLTDIARARGDRLPGDHPTPWIRSVAKGLARNRAEIVALDAQGLDAAAIDLRLDGLKPEPAAAPQPLHPAIAADRRPDCPTCEGDGVFLDDDGAAHPCPKCNQVGAA